MNSIDNVSKKNIMFKMISMCNNELFPENGKLVSYDDFVSDMTNYMKKHKAIRLRPIFSDLSNMDSVFDENLFGDNLMDCQLKRYNYIGGSAPRKNIEVKQGDKIIFTANEAPNDAIIPFHHELAQSSNPPDYIAFYCKMKSESGGQTPLLDSNLVYRFVHENFKNIELKLKTLGVRYTRILPEQDDLTSPLGRSWKNTYNVNDKKSLESVLSVKDGLTYQWLDNDNISITSEILPAIFYNQEVKNYVFFNSIIAAFNGWQDTRNNRFNSITYGNGEKIDTEFLDSLTEFAKNNSLIWDWNPGDIIWIDNRQAMHSRLPYYGTRKIYASLWGRHIKEESTPQMIGLLSNNSSILPITYGLWKLKNSEESTYQAIANGYRRLDSACDYGNECEVGKGITRAINDKICTRSDLHITSKLWNTYHQSSHVYYAFMKTLQDLNVEYLDLYLIHFPISLEYVPIEDKYPPEWVNLGGKMNLIKYDISKTWKELEKLYRKKLVKKIGVCNFNSSLLRQLINSSDIPPHAIQIELHPYLSQQNMLKLSKSYKLEISGFSPLGAKSYFELGMAKDHQDLVHNDVVKNLAMYYSKSSTQILLRWAVERNTIPICKSDSIEHMKENINIFDFSISEADMLQLDNLNQNLRFNDPGKFCLEAFGTFCPIYD